MVGVQWVSPNKHQGKSAPQFIAQRSTRRDGKVKKISKREATKACNLKLFEASEMFLLAQAKRKAQEQNTSHLNRMTFNKSSTKLVQEYRDTFNFDYDSSSMFDGDNSEEEIHEDDVEGFESMSLQDIADYTEKTFLRKNILYRSFSPMSPSKKNRSYAHNRRIYKLYWSKFVKSASGRLAWILETESQSVCSCKGSIIIPAISFQGICLLVFY